MPECYRIPNGTECGLKMKICQNITLLLFAITIIVSGGCSNLDSLVRSVENTFRKENPATSVDTATLEEANSAYHAGNTILAEERYKEFLEKNQRSRDKVSLAAANSQLGRIAFEKSDFKASNRYFEEAIKQDPDNMDVLGLYGENLYWQKEYNRAQTIFQQALQDVPNDRRFQIMLGLTLAQQKQYQAGLRYLKQALGEQGAYEEMVRIYNSHSEFEKATLAMSKARDSYNKQRQLAASFPGGGVSTPTHVDQQRTAFHATQVPVTQQFPVALQTQSYQPSQTAFPPQQQPNAMQQVVRQQPNAVPQQMAVQQNPYQKNPYQNQYQHHYATQQPAQPYPQQQSAVMPNNPYSYQNPYPPPMQNYGTNYGTMNPAAQSGHSQNPGVSMPPQQVFENNPQHPQDNRPPQGFAAMQQPVITAPVSEKQTIFVPFQHTGQEIAYHQNYLDTQPGVMPQGTMYPMTPAHETPSSGMPAQINPLAERAIPAGQSGVTSSANSAVPATGMMTGNWNNQSQPPVFSGYPPF